MSGHSEIEIKLTGDVNKLHAVIQSSKLSPFIKWMGNKKYKTYYYDNSELFSAQGVANRMARLLRMGHLGNPTGGYEGVGMGSSPQAAISNCCYYGRRPLRDSGVAQGANGMWYACCRYN